MLLRRLGTSTAGSVREGGTTDTGEDVGFSKPAECGEEDVDVPVDTGAPLGIFNVGGGAPNGSNSSMAWFACIV